MSSNHLRLTDGTVWPRPDLIGDDRPLAWVLTYTTPTRQELLRAASVVAAYGALIGETTKRRQQVVRDIRSELTKEQR